MTLKASPASKLDSVLLKVHLLGYDSVFKGALCPNGKQELAAPPRFYALVEIYPSC